jgi:hypothetical protein
MTSIGNKNSPRFLSRNVAKLARNTVGVEASRLQQVQRDFPGISWLPSRISRDFPPVNIENDVEHHWLLEINFGNHEPLLVGGLGGDWNHGI